MVSYSNEQLSELCSKFDLLDYVSQCNEVRKVGNRRYILCPCHTEKTPSCFVDKDRFWCFSCHAGGSPIDYMIKAEGLSFRDAVQKIASLTGTNINTKNIINCSAMTYYQSVRNSMFKDEEHHDKHIILPKEIMSKFSNEIPSEWLTEGISADSMRRFEVKIDIKANRIVYPVYDNCGNLINIKGRTRLSNYKELNVPKYLNYFKLGRVDFFAGMPQNKMDILLAKKAIVFEGIKSVMKLSDYGCNLGLSAETSCINNDQVKILIQMGLNDITIAFDSDVQMSHIMKSTETLRRFTNVYVVHSIGDKMSPVDFGKEQWEKLYNERTKL